MFFTLIMKNSWAELSFEITNQESQKTKILFFGFDAKDPKLQRDSHEVLRMIQRNLHTTNLFEIIKDNSIPQIISENEEQNISDNIVSNQINRLAPQIPTSFDPNAEPNLEVTQKLTPGLRPEKVVPFVSVEMLPDFIKYNKAGVGAIVVAEFDYDVQGNIEIKLRLWDVLDQRQLFGKFYSASHDNYQKLANIISDKIFTSLTGEKKGHFNTKILYVSESGRVKNRIKKIASIGFDGSNKRYITNGRNLVLTPIFSKKKDELFYLSYRGRFPQIYRMNLTTMKSEKVGGFYATTFAASAHPKDSNIILLSAIYDGNSDIYEMYVEENRALRLTKNGAIDTTASYSPDGETIAFISDRSGSRQIYTMNRKGTNIRQISKGQGSYSKPIYSPDGKLITFTVQKRGQFYVGTMSNDGSNERLLASGHLVEGAKFSPNSRYLIYSKKRGPYGYLSIPKLFTLDITTGYEYEIPLNRNEGATDPDWAVDN